MTNTAKTIDLDHARPIHSAQPTAENPQPSESDVLHFLTRTLQAHVLDSEPKNVLEKLRNLRHALDQQEITLAEWPDSPSKDRICVALAKARILVAQFVDEYATAADREAIFRHGKVSQP